MGLRGRRRCPVDIRRARLTHHGRTASATRSAPSLPTTTASTSWPTRYRPAVQQAYGAVDLWTLVGRPPGDLRRDLLDQDLHRLPDPGRGPLADQLLGQVRRTGAPVLDLRNRVGAVQATGLGALLVGVAEHSDGVQLGRHQELVELSQVGLASRPGSRR